MQRPLFTMRRFGSQTYLIYGAVAASLFLSVLLFSSEWSPAPTISSALSKTYDSLRPTSGEQAEKETTA